MKYKYCQKCGTTEHRHIARGLCENCYNNDIESRHKPEKRTRGRASNDLSKSKLEQLYVKENLSMGEIAKLIECSRQYINMKLKEYNIPTRSKSKARKLALQKQKLTFKRHKDGIDEVVTLQYNFIDEKFFSKWTPEMAYVLGVIATDGCISTYSAPHSKKKYQRLNIDQKEPELLDKVLFLLKSNIKKYKKSNNENGFIFSVQITNEKIVNDLIKLGITERKSNTLQFPNIPNEYVRHFIRGCWDGDGSIFLNGGQYRANYVCGSFKFISKMINILSSVGFDRINLFEKKGGGNSIYYFNINGDYYCSKLYYYLYSEVTSDQYLDRKYSAFSDAVFRNNKRERYKEYMNRLGK